MAGVYGVYLSVLRRLYLSGELILRFIGRSSFLSTFLVGRRANVFPRRTVFFTVTVLLISLSRVLVKRTKPARNFVDVSYFLKKAVCCQTFIHIFFLSIFAFLSGKRNILSVRICIIWNTFLKSFIQYNIIILLSCKVHCSNFLKTKLFYLT